MTLFNFTDENESWEMGCSTVNEKNVSILQELPQKWKLLCFLKSISLLIKWLVFGAFGE